MRGRLLFGLGNRYRREATVVRSDGQTLERNRQDSLRIAIRPREETDRI